MPLSLSREERLYLIDGVTIGTIPNAGGAHSFTGADACQHISFEADMNRAIRRRRDKTGTRTPPQSKLGRVTGSWRSTMSLAASGTVEVVPDCDPILKALFGKAAVATPGSSKCVYTREDAIKFFCAGLWRPGSLSQRIANSCLVARASFSMSQENAEWTAEGPLHSVLETALWATADAGLKGGLTTSPTTEPSNPVTNGEAIPGFTGSMTIDGTAYDEVESVVVNVETGNELVNTTHGSYYAKIAEGDEYVITVDFGISDTDNAAHNTLKQKGQSGTPIDIAFVIGETAANRWKFALKNVIVPSHRYREPGRRIVTEFTGCRAYGTNTSAKDELTLEIY